MNGGVGRRGGGNETKNGSFTLEIRRGFLRSSVFVFTLFFFTLFLHPHPLSFGQENLPAIIKKVQPSVVSILIVNREGKVSGQGSGFFVNRRGISSRAGMSLRGQAGANVITSEGKELAIKKVIAEDPDGDLIQVSVALEGREGSAPEHQSDAS